ncbi:MAG: type 4a pilus biogenesis protein PilO [Proteobacteria bacterium]|nr:type 4a pilus biogenesis protein PilO [Pseudomonadota bacterium]
MNNKLLISVFFSIIIIVGYLYLFEKGKGTQKTETEVQEEIKQMESKVEELKSQGSEESIDVQIKTLKQEILQASTLFPKEAGITSLLRELSIIGDSSGLQILLFEPQELINEGIYEEIPIKLKLRGTYKQVASFLYGISNLGRIIRVQDMKITGPVNNTSGLIMTESEILITTYRIPGGA